MTRMSTPATTKQQARALLLASGASRVAGRFRVRLSISLKRSVVI